MYLCLNCQRPINPASAVCPYCGAQQSEPASEPAPSGARSRRSPKLILALLAVIAGIWAIIWFALPLRLENPRSAAQHSALDAVRLIERQLAAYDYGASAFPTSLEALGDPARQAAQAAMTGGYSIRYLPDHPDANGNPHAYTLVAVPRNYGYESYYVDQSGVIRATRDNRAATLQDPPVN